MTVNSDLSHFLIRGDEPFWQYRAGWLSPEGDFIESGSSHYEAVSMRDGVQVHGYAHFDHACARIIVTSSEVACETKGPINDSQYKALVTLALLSKHALRLVVDGDGVDLSHDDEDGRKRKIRTTLAQATLPR